MSLILRPPFLPEGVEISYKASYGELTPDDEAAIKSAIIFARQETASRSQLDALIGRLLDKADGYVAKEEVLVRVLTAVASLLPPEEKLEYANQREGE
jgi:hypothetical protein